MGNLEYHIIKLSIEEIAEILYGSDVGRTVKDNVVAVLRLDKPGIERNFEDNFYDKIGK